MWVIITRDDCKFCESAKALLVKINVPYKVYNVQKDECRWILSLLKASGVSTVPQIFRPSGELVGGYAELKELFEGVPL